MFKRQMYKRALSIMLCVALAFQSVPMTALAAEVRAVEETANDEGTGADKIGEDTGDTCSIKNFSGQDGLLSTN